MERALVRLFSAHSSEKKNSQQTTYKYNEWIYNEREVRERAKKKPYQNQQQHTAKMGRWVHFIRRKTRSQLIGHKTLVISSSLERWEIVFAPIQLLLLVLLLDNHCCQWWQHGYFFFPFHVLKNAFACVEVFFRNKIWIETNGRLHKNIFEQFFFSRVLCYQNENGSTSISQYVFSAFFFFLAQKHFSDLFVNDRKTLKNRKVYFLIFNRFFLSIKRRF